ncbi:MBL fold metallo-hydrolase [Candidatus Calescamantes bacterium]|nr:MBL fold metallo-hydrolase [Candidatus Calescamantes bacterium]
MEKLIFLGTGGARVVVSKQIRASGGVWIEKGDTRVLMDPGPGCLIRVLDKKLNPAKLNGIILSHRHLDHSADINVMIEAMTEGGFKKRGVIFAPQDALEDDPVILRYVRDFVEKIEILEEGKTYQIGELEFVTPLRHQHGNAETYGFIFKFNSFPLSWIVDTRFFPSLTEAYNTPAMVIHMVRLTPAPVDHLTKEDVEKILKEVKPQWVILTHFGMTVLRANPWKVAKEMSENTGVYVTVAKDGMEIILEEIAERFFKR